MKTYKPEIYSNLYNGNIESIKTNPRVKMRRKAYRPLILGVHLFACMNYKGGDVSK